MPPYDLGAALSKLWGQGTEPLALLRLPWTVTFETHLFGEALPDCALGWVLAVLPLTALLAAKSSLRWLLGVVWVYCAILGLTFQYARFYVPMHPLVCVLVAGLCSTALTSAWPRRLGFVLATAALGAQILVVPRLFWNSPPRLTLSLVTGRQTPEAYLTQALRPYAAVQLLNGVVRPGEKVLGLGVESIRFYLDAPLGTPHISPEVNAILAERTPDLSLRLQRAGYAYLLIDELSPTRQLHYPFLSEEFLARHARLEFSQSSVSLYRLRLLTEGAPSLPR